MNTNQQIEETERMLLGLGYEKHSDLPRVFITRIPDPATGGRTIPFAVKIIAYTKGMTRPSERCGYCRQKITGGVALRARMFSTPFHVNCYLADEMREEINEE